MNPEETNANVAEVFAELHRFEPRRSPQLYEELREKFAEYPGARIIVEGYQNALHVAAAIALVGAAVEVLTVRKVHHPEVPVLEGV